MTALIKADLYRILRKKSLWLTIALAAALFTAIAIAAKLRAGTGFGFVSRENIFTENALPAIFGAAVFIGIYTDEFTAKSMQAAIGRGVSRLRIIAAKIISCFVLTVIICIPAVLYLLLLSVVTGAGLTAADISWLLLTFMKSAYVVALSVPLAAVIIYLTDNRALSVFAAIALLLIIPLFISLLETNVLFHNLHPSRYTIEGFARRGFSDIMLGGSGIGTLIAGFALYTAAAYLLSALVFARRELDF